MTKHFFWILAIFSFAMVCFESCERSSLKTGDRPLAKAFNRTLYLSEMAGMFPPGEDSALIINAYVERWIRETLLLLEAERNIPSDLNIDKLVRDYRASLVRHSYEQFLVEQLLDSTVTKAELEAFYENNKAQYQLETPIIRCLFIKVPLPVYRGDELRRMWNSDKPEDFPKLVRFCSEFAESHLLEENTWHKLGDIVAELPQGILTAENLGARKEITLKDDQFEYYLRVLEWKNQRDIAPLSYIEDQARRFILRSRIDQVLEDKKDEMYELELRRGNVQIFAK
jgi:hypothetical protein